MSQQITARINEHANGNGSVATRPKKTNLIILPAEGGQLTTQDATSLLVAALADRAVSSSEDIGDVLQRLGPGSSCTESLKVTIIKED